LIGLKVILWAAKMNLFFKSIYLICLEVITTGNFATQFMLVRYLKQGGVKNGAYLTALS